ncbi:MAG: excinuclease ABC subunit UvrC [Candidatus Eisenbacteria bacterium]|nr:excinuclease ABC subunit UvrC [Candidatus Eisenbacteria bacterium]
MSSERLLKIRQVLAALPGSPGVYIMKNTQGRVIYVGKAKRLDHRVRSYFSATPSEHPKVRSLVAQVSGLEYIVTSSESEALLLELTLIKEHQPHYNISLKDDKRYPHVKLSVQEAVPRLGFTRKPLGDGARYFGPFTDVREVRAGLKFLRTVFPVRTCATLPKRACLDHHIGRCVAPCEGGAAVDEHRRIVDELCLFLSGRSDALLERLRQEMEAASGRRDYEDAARRRDQLQRVERLLSRQRMVSLDSRDQDVLGLAVSGDRAAGVALEVRGGRVLAKRVRELRNVAGRPLDEVWAAWITQHYSRLEALPREVVVPEAPAGQDLVEEFLRGRRAGAGLRIPRRGPLVALLEMARQNATLALEDSLQGGEKVLRVDPALYDLQKVLGLSAPPLRIEAFDVSHLQGSETVASLVVLWNARPKRSDYRRFRIRHLEGNDDFRSMAEAVGRRAARVRGGGAPRPDLYLIDGGRGQLGAAEAALREHGLEGVPALGLAKRLEEIYLPGRRDPVRLPRHSGALQLLQRVRDEAHRFAVTYHRKLRAARANASVFRTLPGVGPGRERLLLRHFGSLDALRSAGRDEIERVPGIGARLAAKIHEALQAGAGAGKQTA